MAPKRKSKRKVLTKMLTKVKKESGNNSLLTEVRPRKGRNNKKLSKVPSLAAIKKEKVASIKCQQCSKQFGFKESYKTHLLEEHSTIEGSVACDQCPVRCPNEDTLFQHIQKVHNRELYECQTCKKEFVRHAHVLRHMNQTGCDGVITLYPCEICDAEFTRKDNLMVHLRVQHIKRKTYVCKHDDCTYSTHTLSKLILHTNKEHAVDGQKFECDYCGKVLSSRAAMTKHLEIHGERKFSCDVCGYRTFTIEVMRRHVLTHVNTKPYSCEVCCRSFIQRSQLERHAFRHQNKCLHCSKNFNNKDELNKHIKIHDGEKLVCMYKQCHSGRSFENVSEFRKHIRTHEELRPWSCEVCKKQFRLEMDMRKHVTSHTLERPRRCMYCVSARAYVRGEHLVKHVRKCHPVLFKEHLSHVRSVLGIEITSERVKKSEMESILSVLDTEAERILEGYGEGVLYGGMQEVEVDVAMPPLAPSTIKSEDSPLMSESDLATSVGQLLDKLIERDTLSGFGWPEESVDLVLEKVIENCGEQPADRSKWTRVQRLRENAKLLFLHSSEDKEVARMLDTHTIDQIVRHVLACSDDTHDQDIEDADLQ